MTATLSQADARTWIDRWDAQQQSFLPDREERFTALIDAVQECAGRRGSARPRPGLRSRLAGDQAAAADPGGDGGRGRRGPAAAGARPGRVERPDWLGRRGGCTAVRRPRSASSWLDGRARPGPAGGRGRQHDGAALAAADALAAMYAEVATVLRPGGLMLNGDHLTEDKAAAPTLARLGRALIEREEQRRDPIARDLGGLVGRRDGRSRLWRPRSPSVRGERTAASTTARPPGCSACTSTRCARRASPRSAPSGSTATTACSAGCSAH